MTDVPTTFGKYYLTEKLATGGMAEIFLGKLIGPGGFEKQLVIKQIHPALSDQRHFVDLFVAEAKTLVGLAHGNIVPLYELGVIDDTYFIAMEYIDGPTLWQLTEAVSRRGGALDPGLALFIAAELAKGLDYAHRKGAGVIHRDLSPRNVMLSRDGEVKLVDFGIAVAFGGGESPADDGMPTGSFPYMSPEQVARRPLTGQSDLFSLGVLLWEMLVGARLFARATPEATLAEVVGGDIPAPSARRPGVPERFDALVLRCLERDPARRWHDAGALLSAINRLLYALEPPPGARDVAAVVARYCPPLPRGEHEHEHGAGATPTPTPVAPPGEGGAPATATGGPSTQVMAGARPRGKRAPTIREASFATHVDFEKVLGRATPLVPLRAIRDEDLGPATAAAPPPARPATDADGPRTEVHPRTTERTTEQPAAATPPERRAATPQPVVAAPAPARRLWLLAVVMAALAGLTLVVARRSGGGRTGADPGAATAAGTGADAGAPSGAEVDAGADAGAGAGADAGADADAGAGAMAATDAGAGAGPVDAGRAPPRDAGRTIAAVDAAAAPARTGRLEVGADPWGEVYVDGRRLGRAPNAWQVSAGKHQVEVVFPSDEGEVRRRFEVVIVEGGEESVFADFAP